MAILRKISKSGEVLDYTVKDGLARVYASLCGSASVVAQFYNFKRMNLPGIQTEIWVGRKTSKTPLQYVTVHGSMPDRYSDKKVAELRGLLKDRELAIKGKKDVLVERLLQNDRDQYTAAQAELGTDVRWLGDVGYSCVGMADGDEEASTCLYHAEYQPTSKIPCPHCMAVASLSERFSIVKFVSIQTGEFQKNANRKRADKHIEIHKLRRYDPYKYRPLSPIVLHKDPEVADGSPIDEDRKAINAESQKRARKNPIRTGAKAAAPPDDAPPVPIEELIGQMPAEHVEIAMEELPLP